METAVEIDWICRGTQNANYAPHVWAAKMVVHQNITEEEAKALARIFVHGWHEGPEKDFGDALKGRLQGIYQLEPELKMPGYTMWYVLIHVPYSD
jgi:hypothetical protein